jgi:hypothetical protein
VGWYADGPGKLRYKYGNVVAAARACDLGTFTMVPRLQATDEDDEFFDAPAFLGPLQEAIRERGLPWQDFPFDNEADESGESIVLTGDRDPSPWLDRIGATVAEHLASIVAIIRESQSDAEVHWVG